MGKVLVLDDQPEVRQLLGSVVEKAGHDVLRAGSADEAWALLDQHPDLIFADIDMPGETGVEFVIRLRDHPDGGDVPVVFVTAYRERAAPLMASGSAGVVDVIDKPFRLETISQTLSQLLGDSER